MTLVRQVYYPMGCEMFKIYHGTKMVFPLQTNSEIYIQNIKFTSASRFFGGRGGGQTCFFYKPDIIYVLKCENKRLKKGKISHIRTTIYHF